MMGSRYIKYYTFLFCIVDLEGQQKIAFLEIYVLAMNIFDQNFVAKFE